MRGMLNWINARTKNRENKIKTSKDKNDDYDDTIPMYVRQERKTYAYKTTIDIDIKNVNTFDERKTPQIHNGSQYMKL